MSIARPKVRVVEKLEIGPYVTFVPNKRVPIHNWFHFKEGFSRDFVLLMIKKFKLREGSWVLDPFMGVGTTQLVCKEVGINSIGIEVNPLFYFIANAKILDYDVESLKNWATELFKCKFERPSLANIPPIIKRAFNRYNLEDIIFFREKIGEIVKDDAAKAFFLLALMRAASKVTYAYKDGAVIKFVEKPTIPFRPFFKKIIKSMIRDLKKVKFKGSIIKTFLGDARELSKYVDIKVDSVITSPPYLNKIEYTKVYEIEMKLFLGEQTVNPIRSYIGLVTRKRPEDLPDVLDQLNLPPTALNYFYDLWIVLKELYEVLKDKGRAAIVIAEGIYPDRIVESDIILSWLARETGFKVSSIWVVNRRVATRNRTIKIGVARESIVFLRK